MTTAIEKVIQIAEVSTEELRRSHTDPRTGEVTPDEVRQEVEDAEADIREARLDLETVPIYQVGFRRPDGRTEICDITPAFKESKIRDELIRHGWAPPDEVKRLRADPEQERTESAEWERLAHKYQDERNQAETRVRELIEDLIEQNFQRVINVQRGHGEFGNGMAQGLEYAIDHLRMALDNSEKED